MQHPPTEMIQRREAFAAILPSTVRNPGASGVVEAARKFLSQMDLRPFGTKSKAAFTASLEKETEALQKALPKKASTWGLARKALNIFLRNCLYNHYLRTTFHLDHAEPFFELPLDSLVAKALRDRDEHLPSWRGVKRLEPCDSAKFQTYAARLARPKGYARVHLDALLGPTRAARLNGPLPLARSRRGTLSSSS